MRKSLRIATLVMASLLFFSYNKLKAQVKIGGDPAVVDKNAVLELESTRKGFLLPRLDATGFNILKTNGTTVTQGMIIYLKDAAAHPGGVGFYFKTGPGSSNADWTKLPDDYATAGGPWKLDGNSNVTATSFIGSTNNQPLRFKVNNQDAMSFATDGQLTIPYAHVNVAPAGVNDVLMIGTDGLIQRKDLSLTSVTALNSVKGDVILGGATSPSATGITAAATGQNLNLTFPIMMGNVAGQNYGFMTKTDWDRLNNSAKSFIVKDLDPADATAGDKAASLVKDATAGVDNRWILSLFPATETNPGVVTMDAQSFSGVKTFAEVVISDATPGNTGNLKVDGKMSLRTTDDAAGTSVDVLVRETGDADNVIKKVTINPARLTGGITAITDPSAADATAAANGKLGFIVDNTGTDFSIESAANSVTFKLPTAGSAATRGLVTNTAQNIAGVKTFDDQVIAAKNLTVGGTDATSGININGSVAVKVTTLPSGGGAVAENDYILLVAGNGSATVPVTLPAAAPANKGRIYIVKRTAAASSSDEASVIQISATGGQISGRATIDIDEPYFSVTLISMGTTWEVLSRSATNF